MIEKIVRTTLILITSTFLGCKSNDVESSHAKEKPLENKSSVKEAIDKYRDVYMQTYIINPKSSQQITCSQGTVLNFESKSFGSYEGNVNIEVKEVYDMFSVFINGLNTYSKKYGMLETGGMIYINAKDTLGNNINLSKDYSVTFKNNLDHDMRVFKQSESEEGVSIWDEIEESKSIPQNNQKYVLISAELTPDRNYLFSIVDLINKF